MINIWHRGDGGNHHSPRCIPPLPSASVNRKWLEKVFSLKMFCLAAHQASFILKLCQGQANNFNQSFKLNISIFVELNRCDEYVVKFPLKKIETYSWTSWITPSICTASYIEYIEYDIWESVCRQIIVTELAVNSCTIKGGMQWLASTEYIDTFGWFD